jgi:predicted transcriptional regulator
MPRLADLLPRRELVEVLHYLFDHPESTIRDYIAATGISEFETPYTTIASQFAKLLALGLVTKRRSKKDGLYTAMSREAFEDWCARIVLDRIFDGSLPAFRKAMERIAKKKPPKK